MNPVPTHEAHPTTQDRSRSTTPIPKKRHPIRNISICFIGLFCVFFLYSFISAALPLQTFAKDIREINTQLNAKAQPLPSFPSPELNQEIKTAYAKTSAFLTDALAAIEQDDLPAVHRLIDRENSVEALSYAIPSDTGSRQGKFTKLLSATQQPAAYDFATLLVTSISTANSHLVEVTYDPEKLGFNPNSSSNSPYYQLIIIITLTVTTATFCFFERLAVSRLRKLIYSTVALIILFLVAVLLCNILDPKGTSLPTAAFNDFANALNGFEAAQSLSLRVG